MRPSYKTLVHIAFRPIADFFRDIFVDSCYESLEKLQAFCDESFSSSRRLQKEKICYASELVERGHARRSQSEPTAKSSERSQSLAQHHFPFKQACADI